MRPIIIRRWCCKGTNRKTSGLNQGGRVDGLINRWMNECQIELRLDGWIGERVTRVAGGDPCAWDEMDWLANLINRSMDWLVIGLT